MRAAKIVAGVKPDPGNVWIDVLNSGFRWFDSALKLGEKLKIPFYLAGDEAVDFFGETVAGAAAGSPQEQAAVALALQQYESIINVDFVPVASVDESTVFFTLISDLDAEGFLGFAYLPGEQQNQSTGEDQGAVAINYDAYHSLDYSSLKIGGYDFVTFIHELGHAMGLYHPHDPPETFPGVFFDEDTGAFDMNQGVFTMMSYNDGWPGSPAGPLDRGETPGYGWEGSPMALDIAALQYLYGANTAYRTGDDTYTLPGRDGPGTYYSCLWDAGGIDTIAAGRARGVTIDLRAATLKLEAGGGGFVSCAKGVHGGFTIANQTVIENARGSTGDDLVNGNVAANRIWGYAGADSVSGFSGDDRINGGAGGDRLNGGAGDDLIVGGLGDDTLWGGSGLDRLAGGEGADTFAFLKASDSAANADVIRDFREGIDTIDLRAIDADTSNGKADDAFRFLGFKEFGGSAGELRAVLQGYTSTLLLGDIDGDGAADLQILLTGARQLLPGDFVL
jgi:serralysin